MIKTRHRSNNRDRISKNIDLFETKKRSCPFSGKNAPKIDYKDIRLLSRYVTEKGKIIPRRVTNVSRKKQVELSKAIKRARYLALMSFTKKININQ